MTQPADSQWTCRPVQAQLLRDGLKTAHVTPVSADDIVTAACGLQSFDLTSMTPQDAEFNAHFTLQALPSVRIASFPPQGLASRPSRGRNSGALLSFACSAARRVLHHAPSLSFWAGCTDLQAHQYLLAAVCSCKHAQQHNCGMAEIHPNQPIW